MKDNEKEALLCFMKLTLDAVYPMHNEYPFDALRNIEYTEGEDSDKFNDYHENVVRTYFMKRHIETIAGRELFHDSIKRKNIEKGGR